MEHLSSFTRGGQGGFKTLAASSVILQFQPHIHPGTKAGQYKRKTLDVPPDNQSFVKPIKQCFIKNPRTMPMTRIMLMLIAGWAGQGGAIETTTGILAKHLGRCRRQVFRYLKDAVEEGYLTYTRTKDKIGRYTGIRIYLNFAAIRFTRFQKQKKQRKSAKMLDVTHKTETNTKYIINNKDDELLDARLRQFGSLMGYDLPPPIEE